MIKTQRKIQFHNDCGALVNYEELEKAVLWYTPHPVASNKHIYKYGEYPAVSIGKDKIHIHRLLMMFWLNCIMPSSFCVHQIEKGVATTFFYGSESHIVNCRFPKINTGIPFHRFGKTVFLSKKEAEKALKERE